MRAAQMTRNKAMMVAAREEYKAVQKKKGVDNFYGIVSILQMPILVTWFLSLRYISAMPEIFPSASEGFLWISDMSVYDPYFILPIVSACLSSYSITISPGLKNGSTMPMFEPFIKYLKYKCVNLGIFPLFLCLLQGSSQPLWHFIGVHSPLCRLPSWWPSTPSTSRTSMSFTRKLSSPRLSGPSLLRKNPSKAKSRLNSKPMLKSPRGLRKYRFWPKSLKRPKNNETNDLYFVILCR